MRPLQRSGLLLALAVPGCQGVGGAGLLPWAAVAESRSGSSFDSGHRHTTFRSAPIRLDVGRVVLTPPKETPLQMPPEPFVLTSLHLEVVRPSTGESVPLSEVYNHHVAFYANGGKLGADVICGGAHLDMLDGLVAMGAEARGTNLSLPDGFALPGAGPWMANIHLIRSEGVPDVKRCIECTCEEGGGSEDCCKHGSICPGFPRGSAARNESDVKDYALQYTIGWSPNRSLYRFVKYVTLDSTGCQLEFQVPARCPWSWLHDGPRGGALPGVVGLRGSGRSFPSDFSAAARPPMPECVARVSYEYQLPKDVSGEVVFGKGHVHIGGLNVSAYALRGGGSPPELICTSTAHYGHTWPVPRPKAGDELGYVVGMSSCSYGSARRPVLHPGDRVRVEAAYRTDLWFNGVMGLLDLALAPLQLGTLV